jgi:hypothetical protein
MMFLCETRGRERRETAKKPKKAETILINLTKTLLFLSFLVIVTAQTCSSMVPPADVFTPPKKAPRPHHFFQSNLGYNPVRYGSSSLADS